MVLVTTFHSSATWRHSQSKGLLRHGRSSVTTSLLSHVGLSRLQNMYRILKCRTNKETTDVMRISSEGRALPSTVLIGSEYEISAQESTSLRQKYTECWDFVLFLNYYAHVRHISIVLSSRVNAILSFTHLLNAEAVSVYFQPPIQGKKIVQVSYRETILAEEFKSQKVQKDV